MNATELIEYIRTAEKKTPVKVYIWERFPTSFPNARVFPAGDGTKIVFGDWRDISPAIEAQQDAIADIVIESSCRNSAVPLLDTKDLRARIEPGAIIREQVEIGEGAVIMMGAIVNIGASVGAGTMIDMGAVLGGRGRSSTRKLLRNRGAYPHILLLRRADARTRHGSPRGISGKAQTGKKNLTTYRNRR